MQDSARKDILRTLHEEMPFLRMRFGVKQLSLYGSFAKGTATDESDVDLLVELERPLGFEFVALADHLEGRLGRKVDLATFDSLRRSFSHPRRRRIAEDIQRTLTDVSATPG